MKVAAASPSRASMPLTGFCRLRAKRCCREKEAEAAEGRPTFQPLAERAADGCLERLTGHRPRWARWWWFPFPYSGKTLGGSSFLASGALKPRALARGFALHTSSWHQKASRGRGLRIPGGFCQPPLLFRGGAEVSPAYSRRKTDPKGPAPSFAFSPLPLKGLTGTGRPSPCCWTGCRLACRSFWHIARSPSLCVFAQRGKRPLSEAAFKL